jgi:mono/diheme cytochrome c family protein
VIACPLANKGAFTLALAAVVLFSGCEDNYNENQRYPERTDPLVVEQFEASPVRFDPPGMFPNTLAELPDQKELETKMIDPSKVDGAYRAAMGKALEKYFGTPLHPEVGGIEDGDRESLKLGKETLAEGARYYRLHCLHCHGLPGNGRGPTAPWVNPHPRDYRQGVFKFSSSGQPSGSRKPRREDLLRTLRQGIEGTSMPSFAVLSAKDLDELVSYVIHLSIRGQVEYEMLKEYVKAPAADKPKTADVEEGMKEWITPIIGMWKGADAALITPEAFPDNLRASIEHGFEMFQANYKDKDGKMQAGVGCISCHIDYGRANNLKIDTWGTIVRPMDLTQGVYRGGRRPVDLYWRIHSGINGAQMPASNNAVKTQKETWDLVNFLQVLPYPKMREHYKIVID